MPVFEGQGVELYYEEKGNGQPVVFVHGTICDFRAWSSQVEALSQRFRTITYSRRYAHPNDRKGDVMDSTVQNNSADLEALIAGLGLERVHLVGHSQGGFIATYFAIQHPRLLRSLTLVNAAVSTLLVRDNSTATALKLLLTSPRLAISGRMTVSGAKAAIRAIDAGDRSAAERIFVPALENRRKGLPAKPAGFSEMVADNAATLKETTTPPPQVTALQTTTIKAPTLVVWGELSAPWDARVSELLSKSIPESEAGRIAGAGHFCLVEKPAEVNECMKAFILKHA